MKNLSTKQKVLNSISELPKDATLEDIILKVYQVHNVDSRTVTLKCDSELVFEQLFGNPTQN